MVKYYTNVFQVKNQIVHYFIEDGTRHKEKIYYKPSLGIPSKKETGYKDIYGKNVGILPFDSIWDMNQWRKENQEYTDVYGDVPSQYQFISEQYTDDIAPDFDVFKSMKVHIIDIEVYSNQGFPYPEQAAHPVTAVTIQDMYQDIYYVFGTKPYTPKTANVVYKECRNEIDLLMKVVDFIAKERPDIMTGWNIEGFDIPYIVNRCKNKLEKGKYLSLSPTRTISQSTFEKYNNNTKSNTQHVQYKIQGIQVLDFILLYKKFCLEPRESFALDAISEIELGERKVEYHHEYASLSDLYDGKFEVDPEKDPKTLDKRMRLGRLRTMIKLEKERRLST